MRLTMTTPFNTAMPNPVILLLGRGDGAQHQGMRHLHLFRMRKQMIINPPGENRRFHGGHPELRKGLDPRIQLTPGGADLAFTVHMTSCVLHAIADRPLVYIQSDVIHSL